MGRSTLIREGRVLAIPKVSAGDRLPAVSTTGSWSHDGDARTVRVRRGDTLYAIARRHDTTPRVIAAANGRSVQDTLRVGERLRVYPGLRSTRALTERLRAAADPSEATVHTVRSGDTLWRIATRYNTSVGRLCSINRLSPQTTLYPGMRITVR